MHLNVALWGEQSTFRTWKQVVRMSESLSWLTRWRRDDGLCARQRELWLPSCRPWRRGSPCSFAHTGAYEDRSNATCEISRRLFRVHLPRPLFGNAGGHAHQMQVVEFAANNKSILRKWCFTLWIMWLRKWKKSILKPVFKHIGFRWWVMWWVKRSQWHLV